MKIKDIALIAAYVGQRVVKAICVGAQEIWSAVKYIVFADPVVAQICAENFGDGTGLSEEQAAKVTSLGYAFQGNTEITSFDELVQFENVKDIPQSAFYECTNLKSIKFPDGLESIGTQSFQSCGLLSFTYPTSLKSIGNYAFMNCSKLKIIFADSIEHIFAVEYNYFPFQGLSEGAQTTIYVNGEILTETDIPLGAEKIPQYIFYSNQNIVRIGIPQTITDIGAFSFAYCNNLESDIILPRGVISVGHSAFRGCSNVASYSLNEGLISIGQYSFSGIGNRETFTIPSTVTSIGDAAFFNSQIKDLIIKAIAPPTAGTMFLSCDAIYVPDQSVQAYREASGWSGYADKIWPMEAYLYGIITFADPAVEAVCLANFDTNGSGYISKEEAKAVTDIGVVFSGNTEITSFDELELFNNVSLLQSHAFDGCTNLRSITPPVGLSELKDRVFFQCSSLESIRIPKGVQTIDTSTFYQCLALEVVTFEEGSQLSTIKTTAFYECKNLASITLPSTVTNIENRVFAGCVALQTINIPAGVTAISDNLFYACSALSNVNVANGAKFNTIGNQAFFACTKLVSFDAMDGVVNIGSGAFQNCASFTKFTIPSSVTEIGRVAFYGCTSMQSVICRATTPPTIGDKVFDAANNCTIYVPDASVDAYKAKEVWSTYASRIKPISEYVEPTNE